MTSSWLNAGLAVHRNFESNQTEIHIQKVRDKWVGQPGKVTLGNGKATGRYSEPAQSPVLSRQCETD